MYTPVPKWTMLKGLGITAAQQVPLSSKSSRLILAEELVMPLLGLSPTTTATASTAGFNISSLVAFVQAGGRYVNVRSSSSHRNLQEMAWVLEEAGVTLSELFVSLHIDSADLSYTATILAVERILHSLRLSKLDLVLVGPGEAGGVSEEARELLAGSLAAVEDLRMRGQVVASPGAFDWPLDQMQRLLPLIPEPLAAMHLTFDSFAGSHMPSLKLCLMRGVPVILSGFVEQPGRLVFPMFLSEKNSQAARQGFAQRLAVLATAEWLRSKGVAVLVPGNFNSAQLVDMIRTVAHGASEQKVFLDEALQQHLDLNFWPGDLPRMYTIHFKPGATCTANLEVMSARECGLAMQELDKPGDVVTSGAAARGCTLYFHDKCSAIECAEAQFRAEGPLGAKRSVPVCQLDAAEPPEQGRTLFLSMCMGTEYFDKFCAPFLGSYRMVYGGFPSGWHSMRVWTIDVNASQLNRAKALFAGVHFEESSFEVLYRRLVDELADGTGFKDFLREDQDRTDDSRTGCFECQVGSTEFCDCDPRVHDEKVMLNNIFFLEWVLSQVKQTEGLGYQYVVVIDSDMLFAQQLARFLPREPAAEWEYAFTFYDRQHRVPWGSNEEVAKTRNAHVRINSGVQIFRYTEGVKAFLNTLLRVTLAAVDSGHAHSETDLPKEVLREFKAPGQAAIAWIVGLQNLLFEDCLVCWPEITSVGIEVSQDEKMALKIQGLPARFLNQAESVEQGILGPDTHMVHLKGLWWRLLLLNGTAHSTATRCLGWNSGAYQLWATLYLAWQPQHVVSAHVRRGQGDFCPDPSEWMIGL
ncbi:hypothetical protein AK812_SmicGene6073 [Symbiodinium microadriaticum]|uniref:Uncharacterized protein n=1 Tax=Symbiodinium microadriaticum TaxID=2951 RepID=A0A1Q9ES46_SYMMI|nr:hypothetical protein AK812_SmicGene6073 [Symbiodinium microadriaticum]